MMGGISACLRTAQLAEHFGVVTAPHLLPALFAHLAAAAPNVLWLEHFPLLEPLFDGAPEVASDGTLTPSNAPGHGLRWASGAREQFRTRSEHVSASSR